MAERDEPVFTFDMLEVVTDPDLPPGVVEFRHPDGRRDRFPICEFTVEGDDG